MPTRTAKPSPLEDFARSSMVVKIMIITGIIYVADNFLFGNTLNKIVGLDAGIFTKHWKLWQPITCLFAHAPMGKRSGVMHILFNMYGLWFFGRAVENRIGSREFLAFYLFTGAAAALIWSGIGILTESKASGLIGASGAVSAVVIMFALSYPHQKIRLLFPPVTVPAWLLGIFIVGMDIRGAMGFGDDHVAFAVHLAGAALAVVYFYSRISLTGKTGRIPQHIKVAKKRTAVAANPKVARHTCTVCNVTSNDNKNMQFRYCSKCVNTPCYCEEHIGNHEHIVATADTSGSS